MNITNQQTKVKGWTKSKIILDLDDLGSDYEKPIELEIVHDIPESGAVNSITAAVENWSYRSNKYDDQSLVSYINSKGAFSAMTVKDFEDTVGKNEKNEKNEENKDSSAHSGL